MTIYTEFSSRFPGAEIFVIGAVGIVAMRGAVDDPAIGAADWLGAETIVELQNRVRLVLPGFGMAGVTKFCLRLSQQPGSRRLMQDMTTFAIVIGILLVASFRMKVSLLGFGLLDGMAIVTEVIGCLREIEPVSMADGAAIGS
jgi:hypothetical protein